MVASIHVLFGVGAEPWLGAAVSDASLNDANLDSQNRFYGAAFALFAVVFWYASSDPAQHKRLLQAAFALFFVAGLARILSIIVVGWPSIEVLALTAIELIGPPVMYWWLRQVTKA